MSEHEMLAEIHTLRDMLQAKDTVIEQLQEVNKRLYAELARERLKVNA